MDASRWETEALRAARRPAVSQKREEARQWVTLREAADRAGVPIGTVRSWSKSDAVDTYLELDGERALRMVDLVGVEARARELGRQTPPSRAERTANAEAGTETMIVPIDAWNKMLMQLGNLHEAGQQLAEARERAARAETEAKFLREQLRDLRERVEAEARTAEAPTARDPEHAPPTPTHASAPTEGPGLHAQDPAIAVFLRRVRRAWRALR